MDLPSITPKQQEILKLLYKYRFLNRAQIQILLGHKNHKTSLEWLKDLREKQYVVWIYSYDLATKNKPAIYFLGRNGIRYLKSTGEYQTNTIRRRYRDNAIKQDFISRSMLLADCHTDLLVHGSHDASYSFISQADYAHPDSPYNFFYEDTLVHPQLIISKQDKKGATTNYAVEIFDLSLPQYRIRQRLKEYVTFLDEGRWITERDDPEPCIMFVCPNIYTLLYVKRRIHLYLQDVPNAEDIQIFVTTTDMLIEQGLTGDIWQLAT
jgi:hypothetical protein